LVKITSSAFTSADIADTIAALDPKSRLRISFKEPAAMPKPEALPRVTISQIRALATPQSFARGEHYYQNGAISQPTRQGLHLWADCEGTELYQPTATLEPTGIQSSSCTCPYEQGGICKHQVALLLTYVQAPDRFQVILPLKELLQSHSRDDLVQLIEQMLRQAPDLLAIVEMSAASGQAQPIALATYRKQAERALSGNRARDMAESLKLLAQVAHKLLQAQDWRNAGALYHLLLEESVASYGWDMCEIDYDGDVAVVVQDITEGLVACLAAAATLATVTRQAWLTTLLDATLKDIELGGRDFAYSAQEGLIEYATDAEWQELAALIRTEITVAQRNPHSEWEREALVGLLADRLEHTGQTESSQNLIHELGSPKQQAFLLVEQGQFDAAIAIAQQHFTQSPGLVHQLADALIAAKVPEQALQYILNQPADQHSSHRNNWLANYHLHYSDPATALIWQRKVFEQAPTLAKYQQLQTLAHTTGTWKTLKPEILQQLEVQKQIPQLIEIALHEQDIDRALALVLQLPGGQTVAQTLNVAAAAEKLKPEAAIVLYRKIIADVIARKNRSAYQEAVRYLETVKSLYESLQQTARWQIYIKEIRAKYPTLRALQEELTKAKL
jgi:uncharacterized Zn finger protein